ncbi:glycoside hydrolase family 99-like domain-containing protein [Pedobacter sp. JCM 36344]|uniref:glycoside hydrolase family 99-like domain-containing protein n=1 Tax=Pedobacter sp. JCM 36344 TaxID=3374280 RepID=UPI00397C17E8
MFKLIILFILIFSGTLVRGQPTPVILGAYYFDGWTGAYPYHITPLLRTTYKNRMPKWGWITSTQKIFDEQVKMARNAGLSFFSFCWYNSGSDNYKAEPLNNALALFKKSKVSTGFKYCLTIVNHQGFSISQKEWKTVEPVWIDHFMSGNYLKVDGKPLLIIFSVKLLVDDFGSIDSVRAAFASIRAKAIKNGLNGVSIATCLSAEKSEIRLAEMVGVDLITGYNYHNAGLKSKKLQVPIDSMRINEFHLWTKISSMSKLKYLPVTTLNWDPRPWATNENRYDTKPYFVGYSGLSTYRSVKGLISWLRINSSKTSTEKIGLIYAWNEVGEGAYLTPSVSGSKLISGVKKAIIESK